MNIHIEVNHTRMLYLNQFVIAVIGAMEGRLSGLIVLLDRALLTSGGPHHT